MPTRTPSTKSSAWRRFALWSAVVVSTLLATALVILLVLTAPMRKEASQYDVESLRPGLEASHPHVPFTMMPQSLTRALVAAEDGRFFSHHGVDYIGTLRAAWSNWGAGGVIQGGSTITQQLAKNAFGLTERRLKRKVIEALLARRIEKHFSKEEILTLYLNLIYFGDGYYGIDPAAQGYFGHPAKDLSLLESATLCGLIRSPSRLSPTQNPEGALQARNHVLKRMNDEGFLSNEDYKRFVSTPLWTK